jgi:hypothetical protein
VLQVFAARQAVAGQAGEHVCDTVLPKPARQPLKRVNNLRFGQQNPQIVRIDLRTIE